ncbi:uncharacterized protein SCDLUD_000750 [Saccharomycodes ludwigii]|uniref:uncharacterized protein n=1 Tax=Saccharomycodes ludwigii TaxID=36035 RepID=UPI001E8A4499|nr:hypothetical protein SCDLUD_000750 [Saccharomycodes ludwigii]KAH3903137.1 hypothetical protein SCDLUD_000750 [Saccharomycodes ludwigii]
MFNHLIKRKKTLKSKKHIACNTSSKNGSLIAIQSYTTSNNNTTHNGYQNDTLSNDTMDSSYNPEQGSDSTTFLEKYKLATKYKNTNNSNTKSRANTFRNVISVEPTGPIFLSTNREVSLSKKYEQGFETLKKPPENFPIPVKIPHEINTYFIETTKDGDGFYNLVGNRYSTREDKILDLDGAVNYDVTIYSDENRSEKPNFIELSRLNTKNIDKSEKSLREIKPNDNSNIILNRKRVPVEDTFANSTKEYNAVNKDFFPLSSMFKDTASNFDILYVHLCLQLGNIEIYEDKIKNEKNRFYDPIFESYANGLGLASDTFVQRLMCTQEFLELMDLLDVYEKLDHLSKILKSILLTDFEKVFNPLKFGGNDKEHETKRANTLKSFVDKLYFILGNICLYYMNFKNLNDVDDNAEATLGFARSERIKSFNNVHCKYHWFMEENKNLYYKIHDFLNMDQERLKGDDFLRRILKKKGAESGETAISKAEDGNELYKAFNFEIKFSDECTSHNYDYELKCKIEQIEHIKIAANFLALKLKEIFNIIFTIIIGLNRIDHNYNYNNDYIHNASYEHAEEKTFFFPQRHAKTEEGVISGKNPASITKFERLAVSILFKFMEVAIKLRNNEMLVDLNVYFERLMGNNELLLIDVFRDPFFYNLKPLDFGDKNSEYDRSLSEDCIRKTLIAKHYQLIRKIQTECAWYKKVLSSSTTFREYYKKQLSRNSGYFKNTELYDIDDKRKSRKQKDYESLSMCKTALEAGYCNQGNDTIKQLLDVIALNCIDVLEKYMPEKKGKQVIPINESKSSAKNADTSGDNSQVIKATDSKIGKHIKLSEYIHNKLNNIKLKCGNFKCNFKRRGNCRKYKNKTKKENCGSIQIVSSFVLPEKRESCGLKPAKVSLSQQEKPILKVLSTSCKKGITDYFPYKNQHVETLMEVRKVILRNIYDYYDKNGAKVELLQDVRLLPQMSDNFSLISIIDTNTNNSNIISVNNKNYTKCEYMVSNCPYKYMGFTGSKIIDSLELLCYQKGEGHGYIRE